MNTQRNRRASLRGALVAVLALSLSGCPQDTPTDEAFGSSSGGGGDTAGTIDSAAATDTGGANDAGALKDAGSGMDAGSAKDGGGDKDTGGLCGCASDSDCGGMAVDPCHKAECVKCVCLLNNQPDGLACGTNKRCKSGKCAKSGPWAVSVIAGDRHTCALHASGQVSCWGDNGQGQLGTATKLLKNSAKPVLVPGLKDVVALSTTTHHTCARTKAGKTYCWGDSFWGQIGDGTKGSDVAPPALAKIDGAKMVAAGGAFTVAVAKDDTVWAWGQNNTAQLLDGSAQSSPLPKMVPMHHKLTAIAKVCAGSYHACALGKDGELRCWGKGHEGQVGDGKSGTSHIVKEPTGFTGVPKFAMCDAGPLHTCAVSVGGQLWCWGRNSSSQIGDKTTKMVTKPSWTNLVSSVAQVAVGISFTCARIEKYGSVKCWGRNDRGQLSTPGGGSSKEVVPVKLPAKAVDIAAGREHACAVLEDGRVYCWGRNNEAQLGMGKVIVITGAVLVSGSDQ